ncbi:MAG: hypothetical protein LUF30_02815 [Lachnospiraceae bacterium]|nr:hypothetical protein [Lachnospiraceae bacterium]
MLELMPEEKQIQVYEFTKHLFTSEEMGESGSPFIPVTEEKVLNDLAMSRREITEGKGLDMREALDTLGRQHGFLTEV